MPRVGEVGVLELGPLEMVEHIADVLVSIGEDVQREAWLGTAAERECAALYAQAMQQCAWGLRIAVTGLEAAVEAHLESDCANH